ncbi:MAG TPA: glycosyl hydrolase [Verrucomicrobiae bacterium]|nr:glycosyl hydrolase [Verrucomicrobiae bacterium]
MRLNRIAATLSLAFIATSCSTFHRTETPIQPVTPNASPEAVELLKFIYSISGRHTLTGQHNFPNTRDSSTLQAIRIYGKVPAIFGQDFGFAAAGDKDSVAARPDIMAEVKRQYTNGAIITLCWHAVPPTADEPVTFRPRPGTPTNRLASVQGRLTDEQWKDLLTPGTELHNRWCAQVDVIAGYLKELQAAHIPVLWRPYHEMNGEWFWWGGRRGKHGTQAMYRQIFDRLVHYHHINNLVWIWSVDRPSTPNRQFADYFPGRKYFDIAALDVYRSDFKQSYYDDLLKLAAGKPVTLAEVGPAPTLAILEQQPQWCWWMTWAGLTAGRPNVNTNAFLTLVNSPRSWSLSDPGYQEAITPLRTISGLPPLNGAARSVSQ